SSSPPAADHPASASPPAPRAAGSSQPAIGRIKLVPRVVTRPGLGSPRPDTPNPSPSSAPHEASGSQQAAGSPAPTSGPAVPRATAAPKSKTRQTAPRFAVERTPKAEPA